MKKFNIVLAAIILLAAVLRLVSLSAHPAGFTPDEASFGYDAYSLLQTGKDQWGASWPLVLKSFGDYKMPLYSYLAMPGVFIFGLSEFAVRLPNALFGVLAIFATYLLTKEVFDKKIALFSALTLAISPWHIPLSRGAFEANLTTFFLPMGAYFFLKGLKRPRYMFFAALFFGLNLFTYHSARIVTPIVVLALVLAHLKHIKKAYKKFSLSIITFVSFSTVGLYSLLLGSATRASTSTIFSLAQNIFNDRVMLVFSGEPLILAKIFNNKITYVLEKFVSNYLSYFSLEFLSTTGPREGTYGMVPGVGVVYLIELLFIAVFFISLIKGKLKIPSWLLIWILVAPLPAAISLGPGLAANRAAVVMPAIQIVSGAGFYFLYKYLAGKFKILAPALLFVAVAASFGFFIEDYWFGQPVREAEAMLYGSREVVLTASEVSDQYSEIIVSKSLSEPHIFVAFYNGVPPEEFQNNSRSWLFEESGFSWVDQMPSYSLGKYIFKSIDWVADLQRPNTLLIVGAEEIKEGVNIVGQVDYPNGKPAFYLVDNKTTDFALSTNE